MKKFGLFVLLLLPVLGLLLHGCGADVPGQVSDVLGVDVSRGVILDSRDSHGGFHGDGLLAVTVSFTQEQTEQLIAQFEKTSGWHPFPLTENLRTALYGKTTLTHSQGALIWGDDRDPLPEIKDGWYFFLDRHLQAEDPLDDSRLFTRGSYNVTLAVFDAEANVLYFYELDT